METSTQINKNFGPFSVTSISPGADKIPLGQALQSLTEAVLYSFDEEADMTVTGSDLERFCTEHERYADTNRLAKTSCPHAVRAWAAERLPGLGISYGFSNQLPQEVINSNIDERASLRLVQFADDLTMIARFCRKVEDLRIEATPHSQGLDFRFRFHAKPLGFRFGDVESRGFADLLQQSTQDNCLKNRILATEEGIEAQSIVLRKKIRLGFSPLF